MSSRHYGKGGQSRVWEYEGGGQRVCGNVFFQIGGGGGGGANASLAP